MSHEEIQLAIDQFAESDTKQLTEKHLIPIKEIARTGIVCYKWQSLVIVLLHQLRAVLESGAHPSEAASKGGEEVLEGLAEDGGYQETCSRLYELLESFEGPPFTIQRICELLVRPHQHHKTKRKLLFALDKLLSVTSIVPEECPPELLDGVDERGEAVVNHSNAAGSTSTGSAAQSHGEGSGGEGSAARPASSAEFGSGRSCGGNAEPREELSNGARAEKRMRGAWSGGGEQMDIDMRAAASGSAAAGATEDSAMTA
mmetsp:Transcript_11453/g.31936  ORF Transcript_11453/g.31936 Transcript_11453/m.31936 type:complete len:258 (-) Transcript_11453:874-1647(-)|eukprot:CAMPEP_0113671216 /NCGR_PEP_ID=MMETSP0038_2-20120614/5583_1 /TAXON_ID=2898 /ORGANISM="Cryptomonas paramecium" /LENGTH=257 /DNA_ID=CAMNT_0000587347 /DNA_START=57 /DNA_END=830 /DNA_ORIENTATION=- /assembly_acc=CAM_ASM_000170